MGRNNRYVAEATSSKCLTGKQQVYQSNVGSNLILKSMSSHGSCGTTKGYHTGERCSHDSTMLTDSIDLPVLLVVLRKQTCIQREERAMKPKLHVKLGEKKSWEGA